MSATAKLAGFAALLAAVFGVATLAGGAIDPDREEPREAHAAPAEKDMTTDTHTENASESHGGEEKAAHPVRGLAVAENGLRIVVDDPELRRGAAETLTFRIANERGETVRDFDVEHEKRMHFIVARRDLTGFQHLHPQQQDDGSWTVRLTLDDAGSYRMFADFSHDEEPTTLAADLRVDGAADLKPLPEPATQAKSDGGYDVKLDADGAHPGEPADLRFTITKDGQAIDPEPYLGAGGHLVALREGDLAFLHVHPTDDHGAAFEATFPTEGRYRLFLQFQHQGKIQTVAFTQEVR